MLSLTSASPQECVIVRTHAALRMDPVIIIRGGLDHSTDASILKGALVQECEWTSWGEQGLRICIVIKKEMTELCLVY